jgi:Ca2+-transporting ATPase
MKEPPRDPRRQLIGRAEWIRVVGMGSLTATVTLAMFAWALRHRELTDARDLAFSTLVMSELFRALAARDPNLIYWQTQPLRNLRLAAVVGVSVLLQVSVHHFEFSRRILNLGHLSAWDCVLVVVIGAIPVSVAEIWKLIRRAWRLQGVR